jgi:hypothetical protein
MEWMLQVVDEIDDAISALRLCSLGLCSEIGVALAGGLGIGAIGAAVATGAEITLLCSAAMLISVAAMLKIQKSRLSADR